MPQRRNTRLTAFATQVRPAPSRAHHQRDVVSFEQDATCRHGRVWSEAGGNEHLCACGGQRAANSQARHAPSGLRVFFFTSTSSASSSVTFMYSSNPCAAPRARGQLVQSRVRHCAPLRCAHQHGALDPRARVLKQPNLNPLFLSIQTMVRLRAAPRRAGGRGCTCCRNLNMSVMGWVITFFTRSAMVFVFLLRAAHYESSQRGRCRIARAEGGQIGSARAACGARNFTWKSGNPKYKCDRALPALLATAPACRPAAAPAMPAPNKLGRTASHRKAMLRYAASSTRTHAPTAERPGPRASCHPAATW